MVTLGKKYGRLANRLWIFSYFAANAIEYGYQLTYRNFDEYIKYFDSTSKNNFDGYPIKTRLANNFFLDYVLHYLNTIWVWYINRYKEKSNHHEIMRIKDRGEGYDLNNPEFIKKARTSHVVIRQGGYWYKDNINLAKHIDLVRKFFAPKEKYRRNIEKLVDQCRQKGDCLVGVHLRKADFSRAYQGKYYYDDTFYLEKIQELEKLLKKVGKTPVFVLCSDEKINAENFRHVNFVTGNDHLIEDLYTFAKCDYLMGPPSTYTSWASFYGEVPVKFLLGDKSIISLNNFEVVKNISQVYHFLQGEAKIKSHETSNNKVH